MHMGSCSVAHEVLAEVEDAQEENSSRRAWLVTWLATNNDTTVHEKDKQSITPGGLHTGLEKKACRFPKRSEGPQKIPLSLDRRSHSHSHLTLTLTCSSVVSPMSLPRKWSRALLLRHSMCRESVATWVYTQRANRYDKWSSRTLVSAQNSPCCKLELCAISSVPSQSVGYTVCMPTTWHTS
jgi:hypothetical protein